MKSLMNTQMAEKTPVDIILMSLPKSFEPFRLNYNMNKKLYSLAELLTELQAAESLFQQHVQNSVKKPKGKCFKCKQSGHWKKDCPLSKKNNTGVPENQAA
ncbi:hypothetical protein POM88_008077 [Heracleum sosnowskyi]|uniref:CCHC-type domain-containing protein n=1 Tax=Heracleum sosnowskyi TaxID=360622 RepID=A0AAD8J5Z5_9APIA|nr:hypothetical protein POM88_013074 [Heracleum sosnowskyi]KAK1398214.1 hypothetical protein POM88_008077 [Heracleum sosnowskyi]